MKIDIAKVLGMPNCEYVKWVYEQGLISKKDYYYYLEGGVPSSMVIADLAFRLRDEAVGENKERWLKACFEVDNIAGNYNDGRIYTRNNGYTAEYNVLKRGPIHWVLAALKAKEQSK